MKLFIKNMVCPRCILVVRDILRQAGIEASSVVLGEAVLPAELTAERRKELDEALRAVGFELIDDRRKQTVERVKNTVIELVREKDAALRTNLSDYIADRLHQDYGAVSSLFSEIENTTIEQYFIAQKIERVKELLAYGELSLGEIADKLNYSSTAHLSAQFKKVTGFPEDRREPSQTAGQGVIRRSFRNLVNSIRNYITPSALFVPIFVSKGHEGRADIPCSSLSVKNQKVCRKVNM